MRGKSSTPAGIIRAATYLWANFYLRSFKVVCTATCHFEQTRIDDFDITSPTSKSDLHFSAALDKGNIAGCQAKPRSKRFQRMSSLMKK